MERALKDMKNTLQKLIIPSSYLWTALASAQVNFTEIDNSLLHSQYHPNPNSIFKGTIVFQNGTGSSLEAWSANETFFECIKQLGNLFMYDRSGLGQSSPDFSVSSANPITAKHVNSKLVQLLDRNRIKSPYILVSHSYGGLYAGYFARKYPDSIAGMLMVDPVPSNFLYSDRIQKQFDIALTTIGDIPSREAYKLYNVSNQRKNNGITADGFYQQKGFQASKRQVAELPPMSSTFPIIIMSSTEMNSSTPIKGNWNSLQKQWLNQNPNSKALRAQGGHFIQIERPKLVCEQLNHLVKIAAQKSKPTR
ncbi:alpha/beta hydrolase fold family protein [Synechococcus sp. BIOS-E4-1]|uniref:alpha/beta fold hydrolase n=1 Tax=Synechococcus sp. BIOS-E4-1 TaxID=1400864 RepID=UPI0018604573|nr:alpha/beta hydrolase [Synechococcus sp. BIOS-E4-1]QNI53275.1 alpha/beta hydrolase fold family protein [Synechococcus sp. BIOS-E4-1]